MTGKRNAQRACFAILNKLSPRLEAEGLSADAVWEYVKQTHDVESRAELSELEMVVLQARLSAASRDSRLFLVLCSEVQNSFPQCRVYRINPNLSEKKVYDGFLTADIEKRCQEHADTTGCVVRLHGADGADDVRIFDPVVMRQCPDMPPVADNNNRPAKVFEVRDVNGTLTWVPVLPFPNTPKLVEWAQAHADANQCIIEITTRDGAVLHHIVAGGQA